MSNQVADSGEDIEMTKMELQDQKMDQGGGALQRS